MFRACVALFLVFSGFAAPAAAKEALTGPVEAEVLRVVDGDTLAVRARIWLGQTVEVNVRLEGIDTPEIRGKCAEERESAARARAYLVRLSQGRIVRLSDIRPDKFGGRVLARVSTDETPDFAAALRASGLARSYEGAKRGSWCKVAGGGGIKG